MAAVTAFTMFLGVHLAILAGTAVFSLALIRFGRARRAAGGSPPLERTLAVFMIVCFLVDPYTHYLQGELAWRYALPLQLCDAAGIAAVVALLTRHQRAFELAWFWALAGATQALLTPPLADGPATLNSVRYFALHAVIVATPLYLGPGLGMRPRRGAWWRTALLTLLFALFVGAIDWALDANYMWLRSAPAGSILDHLGPWPLYLAGASAIGVFLFYLLELFSRAGD